MLISYESGSSYTQLMKDFWNKPWASGPVLPKCNMKESSLVGLILYDHQT